MKINKTIKSLLRHFASVFFVFTALLLAIPINSHAVTVPNLYINKYAIGQEIVEKRTENSKTIYLGSSKYSVSIYQNAVHYKNNYADDSEAWKDIDLTPDKDGNITKAPYILTVKDNIITIRDRKTSDTVSITVIDSTDAKFVLKDSLSVESSRVRASLPHGAEIKIDKSKAVTSLKIRERADGDAELPLVDQEGYKNIDDLNLSTFTRTVNSDVEVGVGASADDVYIYKHFGSGTFFDTSHVNLAAGCYSSSYYKAGCGMRFLDINIPAEAAIDVANIIVTADKGATTANAAAQWYSKIRIEDTVTPATYSTEANWDGRSWYGTTVAWSGNTAWTDDVEYTSPDIKTLIQYIVDKAGWAQGSSDISISWDDFDGQSSVANGLRLAYSYDGSTTKCPKLVIDYTLAPTVTTQAATLVEETTATGNATLTDNASSAVTFRGICYDTSTGVDVYDNYVGDNSTGFELGAFTESLTGLTEGTLYYAKGFAMNANGYGYGSEITFLTKPLAPTSFFATAGDNQTVLAFSIPVSADNIIIRFETDGTYPTDPADGTLAYEGTTSPYTHTGLNNGTTYKYRAWSVASGGGWTQYSDSYLDDEATPVAVATMITIDATSVEETTADLNGGITDLRGAGNCSVRGFEYDIDSGSPYAFETHENGSFGVDNYTLSISSLIEGELYYFRSYSTNVNGNGYGSELTFLTKPEAPTLFNAAVISETEIVLTWTAGIGADNTTVRAKLGSYPTDRTDGTEIYNNTGVIYIHSGLAPGETWYYRAWSVASEGGWTQYSDSYSEDYAQTYVAPTVTTGICSGSSTTWAILNGEVTDAGVPSTITQRGFDYGLTTGYGSSEVDAVSAGVGEYYNLLTGLSKSTVYHYRAKVYNGAWAYGEDKIFATKGSPALWDYFITASDNVSSVYGVNWYVQTFTTDNTTGRTVTSIRIPLDRTGTSPGTVTVSLRNTAGGVPTGVDLCYGSLNGNAMATTETWYDFEMNTETTLELNTQYAIVVRASSGTATDYVDWSFVNAGGVDNGTGCTSVNSGITWSTESWDYLFELWGNQAIEIQDAKVFLSYKSTGDWLITCRYVNTFAPYYDTYDIKRYFSVQLIDSTGTVLASSPITEWGNRIGSIYLSASQVTSLEWNRDYRIRIQGLFTGTPYTEYALAQSDWLGDDLTNLDSWCFTSAAVMADYQDEELLINIATRGTVLNAAGGDLLTAGIPGLATIRPDIFQIYTTLTEYTPETTTQTYRQETSNWQEGWGEDGTIMLTRFGNLVGVQGNQIGMMFFIALSVVIALVAFPAGHTIASVILSVIGLIAGVGMGLDIIWLALIGLIAAFLLYKQIFLDK